LDDGKAENIVTIDLAGKSTLADFMVVATGHSNRQLSAMANKLQEGIKKGSGYSPKIEGLGECEWVLIDAGDVIVHLFSPELRQFYGLEKLWSVEMPAESVAV
jgi:ribosome-associated protein